MMILAELIQPNKYKKLRDLAPSFLKWIGVDIPEKMTGDIIIERI